MDQFYYRTEYRQLTDEGETLNGWLLRKRRLDEKANQNSDDSLYNSQVVWNDSPSNFDTAISVAIDIATSDTSSSDSFSGGGGDFGGGGSDSSW